MHTLACCNLICFATYTDQHRGCMVLSTLSFNGVRMTDLGSPSQCDWHTNIYHTTCLIASRLVLKRHQTSRKIASIRYRRKSNMFSGPCLILFVSMESGNYGPVLLKDYCRWHAVGGIYFAAKTAGRTWLAKYCWLATAGRALLIALHVRS